LKEYQMLFDDPVRIYDCSNSDERPAHRGGGGPVMNDIMRYLHDNDEDYYYTFVSSPVDAEVIITNDLFPTSILTTAKFFQIPLVKRMCGPFWQRDLQYRNEPLNLAATQADMVIFITEYSKDQYFHSGGKPLKNHCVVKHWVDPNVFKVDDFMPAKHDFTMTACATDWSRKEKRFDDLVRFAEANLDVQFVLIGKVDTQLPSNMMKMGYLSEPKDIAYILQSSDGFVNLSYRDGATKTIPQAIGCGVPVLYADSGGVSDMVNSPDFGVAIPDNKCLLVEDNVPQLSLEDMQTSFSKFRSNLDMMRKSLRTFDGKLAFRKMLDGYFEAINSVVNR